MFFCFNPRSRVGSDGNPRWTSSILTGFNPRSRVGSDVGGMVLRLTDEVSIHAPAWGATVSHSSIDSGLNSFNPRSRVGSDLNSGGKLDFKMFQSTLPRGERPISKRGLPEVTPVSIHAPAWGATWMINVYDASKSCFNPRSRVGSDGVIPES